MASREWERFYDTLIPQSYVRQYHNNHYEAPGLWRPAGKESQQSVSDGRTRFKLQFAGDIAQQVAFHLPDAGFDLGGDRRV